MDEEKEILKMKIRELEENVEWLEMRANEMTKYNEVEIEE